MASWLARAFRMRRLDRNPLRRPSDRAETIADIFLVVAFVVALPFTVLAALTGTYTFAQDARATALATRQEVAAVTLEAAPSAAKASWARSWVSATWAAPDGRQRTGQLLVDDGTPRGSAERIWVTRSGDTAPPPLPASEFSQLADLAAVIAGMMLAALLLTVRMIISRVLNRERMAAWETGWEDAERRWNHQRW